MVAEKVFFSRPCTTLFTFLRTGKFVFPPPFLRGEEAKWQKRCKSHGQTEYLYLFPLHGRESIFSDCRYGSPSRKKRRYVSETIFFFPHVPHSLSLTKWREKGKVWKTVCGNPFLSLPIPRNRLPIREVFSPFFPP